MSATRIFSSKGSNDFSQEDEKIDLYDKSRLFINGCLLHARQFHIVQTDFFIGEKTVGETLLNLEHCKKLLTEEIFEIKLERQLHPITQIKALASKEKSVALIKFHLPSNSLGI